MTWNYNRPEPEGNEGFRAHLCSVLGEDCWKGRLNHRQRTLAGILLSNLAISLKDATNCYSLQEDFRAKRTRYELKKIYRKRFNTPTCASLMRNRLCNQYCGRHTPDLNVIRNGFEDFRCRISYLADSKISSTRMQAKVKDYYLTCFKAPEDLDYKFRFFKIETEDRWLPFRARSPKDLTITVRRIASKTHILGLFYSLGRFVSPKRAEKDRSYVLIDYAPILDYDLHAELNENRSDYEEQNRLFSLLLEEKTKSFRQEAQLRRIIFTGGGFHFYVRMPRDEARKHGRETNGDPIFDDKRVARLENSLNLRYNDIRICKEVKGVFNLKEFVLAQ